MLRSPLAICSLVVLGLCAFLFSSGFLPGGTASGGVETEQFFFEVNEAAGAPVLILAAWLLYRRSHLVDTLGGPGAPRLAGVTFAVASVIYAWAWRTSAPDLLILGLVVFLLGTLLAWGGRPALRAFWLPAAFLLFAAPISPVLVSVIVWPVQLATAEYAGLVLNAIGMPSVVQGDQIIRPQNTFIVIETCSGLRSVVTLSMLTILLIDLFERRGRHALLLLCLAPLVALFTNVIRVVTLVLNPHSDVASIHSLQGIFMLLVGLLIIYAMDIAIARWLGTEADPGSGGDYGLARGAVSMSRARMFSILSPVVVLMLFVGIRVGLDPWDVRQPMEGTVDSRVVAALGNLRSVTDPPDYKFRGGIHFRSWSRRRLRIAGGEVGVFVGLANPTNRKLSPYSKRFDRHASGYVAISESRAALAPGAPPARRVVLGRGAARVLSYSWYEPEPGVLAEVVRHAFAIERSPLRREEPVVGVRLTTRIGSFEDESRAEDRLRAAFERIAPVVVELRRSSPAP